MTKAQTGLVSRTNHRGTSSAKVLLELPVAAAARLPRDDEIQTRHESDELTAGARLLSRIIRDAFTAASAFLPMARGQFPSMRKDLGIEFPAQLGSLDVVRRRRSLLHKPFGNHLSIPPAPAVEHAVCDPGQ